MATTTTINSGIHARLRTFISESPSSLVFQIARDHFRVANTDAVSAQSVSSSVNCPCSFAGRLSDMKLTQIPINGNSMMPFGHSGASVWAHGQVDAANNGRAARSPKLAGGREGAQRHHGRTGTGGVPG